MTKSSRKFGVSLTYKMHCTQFKRYNNKDDGFEELNDDLVLCGFLVR